MDEISLEEKFNPSPSDYGMRKNLWQKVKAAELSGIKLIETQEIFSHYYTKSNFFANVTKNPYRVAWLFLPLDSFQEQFEEILYRAIKKLRNEVNNLNVTEKNMGHFVKILEFLTNRTLGPMTQKIESKNLNVELTASEAQDPKALELKLYELKEKMLAPRNVTPQEPE